MIRKAARVYALLLLLRRRDEGIIGYTNFKMIAFLLLNYTAPKAPLSCSERNVFSVRRSFKKRIETFLEAARRFSND